MTVDKWSDLGDRFDPMTQALVIMAAVNGARRMPSDHPALPVIPADIATACAGCFAIGAQAAHVHARDAQGRHSLDPGTYQTVLDRLLADVGREPIIQVTTEAVGRYSPAEQMELVRVLRPEAVSIAVGEIIPGDDAVAVARDFYRWARHERIAIQHIIYTVEELARFLVLADDGVFPGGRHALLFPLGRYAVDQESRPAEMLPLLHGISSSRWSGRIDWMVCAFGRAETAALATAAALGGHCRIGFENNLFDSDGRIATDNAARVEELLRALTYLRRPLASRQEAMRVLGAGAFD